MDMVSNNFCNFAINVNILQRLGSLLLYRHVGAKELKTGSGCKELTQKVTNHACLFLI